MKLIDMTEVLRSKNAGPLYMTFDLIFKNKEAFEAAIKSRIITKDLIAQLYAVKEADVSIFEYGVVNSIKVTIPRKHVSGSVYDTDIYGCGQHMPLANVEVKVK